MSRLSASSLGQKAGLSKSIVSMIENGDRRDPSSSVIGRLARVLGISADWLISGDGEQPSESDVLEAVSKIDSGDAGGTAA